MIVTLKIVPKKLGSMVFPWHGHDVCYSLQEPLLVALRSTYMGQNTVIEHLGEGFKKKFFFFALNH